MAIWSELTYSKGRDSPSSLPARNCSLISSFPDERNLAKIVVKIDYVRIISIFKHHCLEWRTTTLPNWNVRVEVWAPKMNAVS